MGARPRPPSLALSAALLLLTAALTSPPWTVGTAARPSTSSDSSSLSSHAPGPRDQQPASAAIAQPGASAAAALEPRALPTSDCCVFIIGSGPGSGALELMAALNKVHHFHLQAIDGAGLNHLYQAYARLEHTWTLTVSNLLNARRLSLQRRAVAVAAAANRTAGAGAGASAAAAVAAAPGCSIDGIISGNLPPEQAKQAYSNCAAVAKLPHYTTLTPQRVQRAARSMYTQLYGRYGPGTVGGLAVDSYGPGAPLPANATYSDFRAVVSFLLTLCARPRVLLISSGSGSSSSGLPRPAGSEARSEAEGEKAARERRERTAEGWFDKAAAGGAGAGAVMRVMAEEVLGTQRKPSTLSALLTFLWGDLGRGAMSPGSGSHKP